MTTNIELVTRVEDTILPMNNNNIQKFNYLSSLLQDTPYTAISGLPLTQITRFGQSDDNIYSHAGVPSFQQCNESTQISRQNGGQHPGIRILAIYLTE